MRNLLLFITFLFTTLPFISFAQLIKLTDENSNRNMGKAVKYLEDTTGMQSLEKIKQLEKSGKFQAGMSDILNLGNKKSAFWIKLNYTNQTSGKTFLIIDVPTIENIDCYVTDTLGNVIQHMQSGYLLPSSKNTASENRYTFSLPEQKNKNIPQSVYLKVKTTNFLFLPIKLATSDVMAKGPSTREYLEIIYIGVLLSLFIFNIFLYFSMKDKLYLYYCLYVPFLFIYVALYLRGYAYFLGQDIRAFINLYPHAFLSIATVFGILFSRRFLDIKVTAKSFQGIYNIMIYCSVVLFFISIFGFKSLAANVTQLLMFLSPLILWISGFASYRYGHTPAKYYLMAWGFIALTIMIVVLTFSGFLPIKDLTFDLIPVGSAIELLLLSLAMGYRYNVVIKRERKTRDENLMLISDQNLRLENIVEERTLKLSQTISELEFSNSVKNKLFSIIAHDLRSPFNSLTSIFALKDMDLLTLEDYKMLLTENQKHIDTINNSLNNLLYWARKQMELVHSKPDNFDLKPIIEELLIVYLPLINKKDIKTDITLSESFVVYADEDHVQLILRNLIDNAIKFTPSGNIIGIDLTEKEKFIEISVWNTIPNPQDFDLKRLRNTNEGGATYGTNNEKGMGLGLTLIREYLKANNSKLEINLIKNRVSFSFILSQPNYHLPLSSQSSHPAHVQN